MATTSTASSGSGRQVTAVERDARVRSLLAAMSLREKLGQLTQVFSGRDLAESDPSIKHADALRRGEVGSFIWALYDAPMRNRVQRLAVEESRLGIPILFGMDIIHGARTTFPIALGLSCSFEPDLFEQAQAIAARESSSEGVDWVFTPMCDLARDPRWGRVAETCGEDPYLSALCNAAQVVGLQGDDISAEGKVAACLKHFIGYSAVTGGRDYNETELSEWSLRNGHAPAFVACLEANAETVMSSFNAIGGIPCVANRRLLTGILREEWGFEGFVVSDWNAVQEAISWGFARDRADAARLALEAGNDMDMMTSCYLDEAEGEVSAGRLSMAVIDEAVRRVLKVKIDLGLFERPYVDESDWSPQDLPPSSISLAKECAVKSTVLLKNESVLPFDDSVKKIALIGPFADDPAEMLGCWSDRGRAEDVVTLAEGLRAVLGEAVSLEVLKGCEVNSVEKTKTLQDGSIVRDARASGESDVFEPDQVVALAEASDVVIMALGEPAGWTGEAASRTQLGLTGRQQALFDAVAEVGKPVVTVLFSGRPLAVSDVYTQSAAVLCAWQPGIQGGAALADLLVGKASPSGRLTMSVPHSVGQVPIYYNRARTGRPYARNYRDLDTENPRYQFGYGLTYTRFKYDELRLETDHAGVTYAKAQITNIGDRAGLETVQLYIRQLACHVGARPEQELRGFRRITLQPCESTTVSFELTSKVLGFTNLEGGWQVDSGDYLIYIAAHAHTGDAMRYVHP